MTTALWILWVASFAVLEGVGLRNPKDNRYTLTNRVRGIMRTSPYARVVVRAAITVGLVWLGYHFLVVDPVLNPGA